MAKRIGLAQLKAAAVKAAGDAAGAAAGAAETAGASNRTLRARELPAPANERTQSSEAGAKDACQRCENVRFSE